MDVVDWLRSLASATTLFDRVKSTATKSGGAAICVLEQGRSYQATRIDRRVRLRTISTAIDVAW